MNRLRSHYKYVVQYDLITKLSHINCITLPKIESVTLNFGIKESVISTKKILAPLLALELVTGQKEVVTKSKKDLIRYKIRKPPLLVTFDRTSRCLGRSSLVLVA